MMTVSEIYTTSPTQGPEKVLESFALLDQLHIPYSRVEHEPAETMEAWPPFLTRWASASAKTFSSATAKRPISTC